MSTLSLPATPRFAWSPRCGITYLTVETVPGPGAAGVLVWSFTAPEQATVAPPVVYGTTPRGATSSRAAQPLVAGITYRVTVSTTVGGDAASGSGSTTFLTPQ